MEGLPGVAPSLSVSCDFELVTLVSLPARHGIRLLSIRLSGKHLSSGTG